MQQADLSGEWRDESPANAQYRRVPQAAKATAPLVLVEGFLSYTSEYWWGDFAEHLNAHRARVGSKKRREIIFARVGPVSSIHDRAVELYYSLKGGRVDYGEAHAREAKHDRFGRNHSAGLYPSWSSEHPLHFLGHSMGGVTIIKMLTLIRQGFFPDSHPDMVASVNTVGSPFRGSQLTYWMTGSKSEAPNHGFWAISKLVSRYVHTLSWFSPLLPSALVPDFHVEARNLTMRDMSFLQYVRQMWKSDWAEGRDAAPYDCTFEASAIRDEEYESMRQSRQGLGKKTWFRSYAMTCSERIDDSLPHHYPSLSTFAAAPLLWFTSIIVGAFDFTSVRPLPDFFFDNQQSSSSSSRKSQRNKPHVSFNEEFEAYSPVAGPYMEEDEDELSSHASSTVFDEEELKAMQELIDEERSHELDHSSPGSSSPSPSTPESENESEPESSSSSSRPLFLSSLSLTSTSSSSTAVSDNDYDSPDPSPRLRSSLKGKGRAVDFGDDEISDRHLPESYWANDGIVPVFSQVHPGPCDESTCIHYTPLNDTARLPTSHLHAKQVPRPGIWNVVHVKNAHHMSLMPVWSNSTMQRTFWYGLGEWLEEVDAARSFVNILDGTTDIRILVPHPHTRPHDHPKSPLETAARIASASISVNAR